jgi:hypothetical protein
MAGQRQDYILSQIELLRQFVARLARSRERIGLEEGLQLALNLQEKLFPLPAAEFLALPVDDQIAALRAGESAAGGHDRCLTYARLLRETACLYEFRGRTDLAAGARQLALQVAVDAALAAPADAAAATLVGDLLPLIEPAGLHPPVRQRLDLFLARVR